MPPTRWIASVIVRLIGVLCIVTLGLVLVARIQAIRYGIDHAHVDQHCYHYCHYIPNPWPFSLFRETVTDAGTLWTAIASLVGLIALWGIYEQIRSTQTATNETKRSVDAFVEAERGRLHIHSLREENNTPMSTILHFTLENIGRGLITLTGEQIVPSYLSPPETTVPVIESPFQFESIFQPIPAGGRIFTSNDELGIEVRRPVDMPVSPQEASHLVIRMIYRYQTSFGEVRIAGFTFVGNRETRRINRLPTQSYSFDVPDDFDFDSRS